MTFQPPQFIGEEVLRIPTLRTARLVLRAPRAADLPAWTAFLASDRTRFVGGPRTRDTAFDQLGAVIGHWRLLGYGRWIVADSEQDTALGLVGLMAPPDWPEPEIAWTMFGEAEGRGFAFEAATATRDYAYRTLGWDSVVSCIVPGNTRSVALAERMGAVWERDVSHPEIGPLQVYRHRPAGEVLQ